MKNKNTNHYRTTTMFSIFILLFLIGTSPVWAGPNSSAGCALDTDYKTRDYNPEITPEDIDSTAAAKASDEILIAVIAQNVANLDTYQAEISFDAKRMAFIEGYEDNSFGGITNLLKKNGGATIGFQAVEKNAGTVNIANSLAGKNTDEAPEGSGIIALLKFKVLDGHSNNHITLSNVNYLDSANTNDSITNLADGVINPLGDIDGDGKVNLGDAVLALKVLAGIKINHNNNIGLRYDVNGDKRIGTEEVVYALQFASGITR